MARLHSKEKLGPDPSKKQYSTDNFSKEILEFSQGHRRLWPCETSSVSLQQSLVPYYAVFLTGLDPVFL